MNLIQKTGASSPAFSTTFISLEHSRKRTLLLASLLILGVVLIFHLLTQGFKKPDKTANSITPIQPPLERDETPSLHKSFPSLERQKEGTKLSLKKSCSSVSLPNYSEKGRLISPIKKGLEKIRRGSFTKGEDSKVKDPSKANPLQKIKDFLKPSKPKAIQKPK